MDKIENKVESWQGKDRDFLVSCTKQEDALVDYQLCIFSYIEFANCPNTTDLACMSTIFAYGEPVSSTIKVQGYRKNGKFYPDVPWHIRHEYAHVLQHNNLGSNPDH